MEGELPDGWTLMYRPLPGRLLGETVWPTRTITIDPRCPAASQRCTLVHELLHVERGPLPAEMTLAAREELAVEKAMARRLIDIRELGEALAESDHLGHVAELLHVDADTLTVRLKHLHPAERAYLRTRMENRDTPPENPAGCCPAPGLGCAECEYRDKCSSASTGGAAAAGRT